MPSYESRVRGCLLGGALGDSLGYAVEFDSFEAIQERYGSEGLTSFEQLDGGSHFSDDTQMTLYTVDGLLDALEWANQGVAADEAACLWLAYLRWLATQGEQLPPSAPVPLPRWIDSHDLLRHRRAPGNACISGLAGGEMGTIARPVNPESKGCGTVMRSAPFGLIPHISRETIYKLSIDGAALTHGHPSARQSAGAFSLVIQGILGGLDVAAAVSAAVDYVAERPDAAPEVAEALSRALRLGLDGERIAPSQLPDALGEGWVAEEALAIGVYAVLATEVADPEEHFRKALAVAVNHRGDSDSTASIAGNILGALYGETALPEDWLKELEGLEIIQGMADRLIAVTSG